MAETSNDTRPILIIGGGIGGLAAARALSRQGRRSHILEQAPEFGEVGAGIQLGPNAFRMFEVLGLTGAEVTRIMSTPRHSLRTQRTAVFADLESKSCGHPQLTDRAGRADRSISGQVFPIDGDSQGAS